MMELIIAWRNLLLHRNKTLMLGSILCLALVLIFLGNTFVNTAVLGLQKMFVQGYTGDLMVTGPTEFAVTVLGETAGDEEFVPHISDFLSYQKLLSERSDVEAVLPLLVGQVAIGLGEDLLGTTSTFGVDIEDYRAFFSGNIQLVEGSWPVSADLDSGESDWILLSERTADKLASAAGTPVGVGSVLTLSAINSQAGTVIRKVRVAGLIHFNQSNEQLALLSLCGADTLRDLLGFASLRDGPLVLDAEQAAFVEAFDPDTLFDDDASQPDRFADESSNVDLNSLIEQVQTIEPAWQFLLVKAAQGADAARLMDVLRQHTEDLGEQNRVQDWVAGAGSVAKTAVSLRFAFGLVIAVLAVLVIIITMNTLVVSISERIGEIGTLRALGASKSFVRRMVLFETGILALLAGIAGIFIGAVILLVLGKLGLKAPNLFFEALFAGPRFYPHLSWLTAVQALVWVAAMNFLASLYPVYVALQIQPIVAMQAD